MGNTVDVKVPDIGDYKGVPVIEVLVKDGDAVDKDAPLAVLESDKATMEVPSPGTGTVRGLKLKVGDKVSQGDFICQLEQSAGAEASPKPAPKAAEPAGARSKPAAEQPSLFTQPSAPEAKPAAPGGGSVNVTVPDIGDYKNVPVIEVLVKDGEAVVKDAPLAVLESDKATMEVPSPAAGTVRDLKLKAGDKVSQGDAICRLETDAGAAPSPPPEKADRETAPAKAAPAPMAPQPAVAAPAQTPPPALAAGAAVYAGPGTRKFARQLGVDLSQVKASGPRGRIVVEDVQAYVKSRMSGTPAPAAAAGGMGIPPIPAVDFSQWGPVESKPLARIRKLSAAHLHRSWLNVPHVTQFETADITELEAFRKQQSEETGAKITLLAFMLKAVSVAMKQYPEFNASLAPDGENLVMKQYCHIGFAADTPNGLVVPVVRDVWSKGVVQLANECAELAKKARDGKLKAEEMKGGCFSISSLGGIGGSHFTPIVNAPEVAILGVSRAQMQPVWDGQQFVPRLICPLSLSYDHRVIDGASAARFVVLLGKLLTDLRRIAL